jgi:hypothetical protein
MVSTPTLIEQVPDDKETSITVPDVYETYINSLAPGERPIPLNVAQESHALQSIMMVVDNREEVEGIIDPGSQIIAMSEAVCNDIGLVYDPSICSQPTVRWTSHSVYLVMYPARSTPSPYISKSTSYGLQPMTYY